jgi:Bacterial extracellular solute-binding proteins, family 5 Middle
VGGFDTRGSKAPVGDEPARPKAPEDSQKASPNAPASWSAATESAQSPLWMGCEVESDASQYSDASSQSGDFAPLVTALQNLAGVPGVLVHAPASWTTAALCRFCAITCALLLVGSLFAAAATTSSTPKRGGTLRLAFQNEFATLDPAVSPTSDYFAMQRFIFRGMFDYDDQDQLILDQSQDWSLSADKKTCTFHLRPGIRFANGREVEAEDYIFALERALDPKTGSGGQSVFFGIRGAEDFSQGKGAHVAGLRAPDRRTHQGQLAAANSAGDV